VGQMTVTKLEAARRQIDEAIRLLFEGRDSVAVHTLAIAALHVLKDLSERRKGQSGFLDNIKAMIRPGMEKRFWNGINRAANFFKHADRDPGDVLQGVADEANDYTLLLNCYLYRDLTSTMTVEMKSFDAWFTVCYPDILVEGRLKEWLVAELRGMPTLSRAQRLTLGRLNLERLVRHGSGSCQQE
jgi:hypothetical protein